MNCMNCGGALLPGVSFCPKCGSTVAQETSPLYQPPSAPTGGQARTSWDAGPQGQPPPPPPRRKSRAGKILLAVFAVLVLVGVGAGLAVYFGYKHLESSLKSSEAYLLAESELRRNALIAERLGEIKSTGFPVGTYKADADGTGSAAYTVSVVGTKASGRYFVTMTRAAGVWSITRALLQLEGGESINVAGPPGEGDETPNVEDISTENAEEATRVEEDAAGGKVVSAGVLNGKAVSKPAPAYPPVAKAVKASGMVVVQVEVNERGEVTKAQALSGHPLLRAAAEAAARQARFAPTLLSGKPVKVTGVLTYEFKSE